MIIWLASYPKSGNTWVRYFLKSYFNSPDKKLTLKREINDNFHSITFPDIVLLNEMKIDYLNFHNITKNWIPMQDYINLNNKTNFLKTHNAMCTINNHPFTNTNNTLGAIYIVRDPRDVVASYAHHNNVSHEEIVESMINSQHGEYPEEKGKHFFISITGSWSDHYNSWKTYKGRKIIIIKYEDLVLKTNETFSKIIKYLNDINKTVFDEKKIKFSIEQTNFQNLRKLEEKEGFAEKGKGGFFFRKGKIGSWKDELNKDLVKIIEEKFRKEMLELEYI
tara:strand:+ start:1033 stop:1866 length:834 start_codon:yes stop_codon:yes gene_type:complete